MMLALALALALQTFPSIVIILGDDVADRDVDEQPTPHLDALASQGIRFRQAYANPSCSVTRMSALFGYWRKRGGGDVCPGSTDPLGLLPAMDSQSLPRVVPGYATAHIGKWHAGRGFLASWEEAPQGYGFEKSFSVMPMNVGNCLAGGSYTHWLCSENGQPAQVSSQYVDLAIWNSFYQWTAQKESRPRLAWICPQNGHNPHHVPPPELLDGATPPSGTALENFGLQVQALDNLVGMVMDRVDLTKTIVWFVGDNGSPVGLFPRAKTTTYDRGVRVPMILAGPGIVQGQETDALFHVVDIMATVAAMAGKPAPAGDGVSLWGVMTGKATKARTFVYCARQQLPGTMIIPGLVKLDECIVRNDGYKLRKTRVAQFGPDIITYELYNLNTDPDELTDLSDDLPVIVGDLEELIPTGAI